VHLLLFCNGMKLDVKRGELVPLKQKLVPRSHTGIFSNERIQSTTLELDTKQGELVQLLRKFLLRSHVGVFLYKRTQSTTLDPELMFWYVV